MLALKFIDYCLLFPSSFLKAFLLSDMILSVVNMGNKKIKKKKSHVERVIITGLQSN